MNIWTTSVALRRHSMLCTTSLATLGWLTATMPSNAADTNWTGGSSTDWFTAGNWSAGVPGAAFVDARIDTDTPNATVINAPNAVTNNLYLGNTGTGALTILNGGTLASNGSGFIGINSIGTMTVTGSGSTWTSTGLTEIGGTSINPGPGTGAGTLNILNGGKVSNTGGNIGIIGSTGAVMVDGSGSTWTNSSNLFVGLSGNGTLTISNGGTVSAPAVIVASPIGGMANPPSAAGTLNIGAALGQAAVAPGTLDAPTVELRLSSGQIVFNHTATNYVFAPQISGAGSVTAAAGTTILTGANTYTGGTTISGGMLVVSSDNNLGATTGGLTLSGGTLRSYGTFSTTRAITTSSAMSGIDVTGTNNLTLAGVVGGGGALTKTGTGTLTLAGANTYSGGTTVSGGSLVLGNAMALGSTAATTLVSGGGLDLGGFTTVQQAKLNQSGGVVYNGTISVGTYQLTGGTLAASATVNASTVFDLQAGTVNGTLAGTGALIKSTAGTVTLTGTNTYTGGTLIGNGVLSVSSDVNLGSTAGGDIALNGGTLQATASFSTARTITTFVGANPNGIDVTGANNLTLTGRLASTGGSTLIKSGTGTLTFGSTLDLSSYTAGLTLAGGTLSLQQSLSATFGTITTTGSVIDYANGVNSAAPINVNSNTTQLQVLTGVATQSGAISETNGPRPLEKIGSGVLNLTAVNSYTGLTTISGGTLALQGAGSIAASSGVSLAPGAAFDISQAASGAKIQTLNGTAGGTVALGAQMLTVSNGGSFGGVIQDAGIGGGTGGRLTVAGGALTLSGANTYTGGTTISGGMLSVSSDGNLGAATGGITFTGGTLQATASFSTARAITTSSAASGIDVTGANNLTLAGVVSGSGALTKAGTGTLTLTGANTYSGGTTISAGTLQLGNGGTSGSMVGDVTDNGQLVFNRSNDLAFGGAISGAGVLRQTGSGTTVLTGDSSGFAGTTAIENGILAVNGALGGTLDVWSTARLQGIGTVGNTSVSGMIAPGNGSIGTLNVAGNITFNAGSIYQADINVAGQSDLIKATGVATINGGTIQVLNAPGAYAIGSHYTLVTASSGVSGTFTGLALATPMSSPFLSFGLTYDPTNVYLDVSRSAVTFASVGQTLNQIATGNGLDSLPLTGPLIGALVQLDAASARSAFDQLSGEVHASARTALIDDSRFVRGSALDRLRSAFDAPGAINVPVMSYAPGGPSSVKIAPQERFAIWGQAYGSWGRWNGDGNAARLNRSTGGFTVGVDTPDFGTIAMPVRVGLLAGYSNTGFSVGNRASSGSSDNYHLGLYGGTQWGALGFRAGAVQSWHDIRTTRSVVFPGFSDLLQGNTDARTTQLFGDIGYRIQAGSFAFEPFANLAYVNLRTHGFRETGGAAALSVQGRSSSVTFSTLGLRASSQFDIGGMVVTARGTLGWRHAFGAVTPQAVLAFAGGTPFAISGVAIAKNAAVVEAGLDVQIAPSATLGISYTGQFARTANDQSLKANLAVKF